MATARQSKGPRKGPADAPVSRLVFLHLFINLALDRFIHLSAILQVVHPLGEQALVPPLLSHLLAVNHPNSRPHLQQLPPSLSHSHSQTALAPTVRRPVTVFSRRSLASPCVL